MTVGENNADKFEAKNGSITMDIYPRKGENLTYSGMKTAIVKWARQTDLSYDANNSSGNEQPIYLSNLNGYWGCAIDGTKLGFPATMMLLVDPDYTDISCLCRVDPFALRLLERTKPNSIYVYILYHNCDIKCRRSPHS